jgi:positive regulator of sigma E activity
MRETGTVKSVDGDIVVVSVGRDCGQSCQGCAKSEKGGTFSAYNGKGIALSPGDCVEVFVAPHKAVLEAVLLFILPLVLFALFYALSRFAFGLGDDVGFFIGCGGIVVGFLLNFVRKLVRKNAGLPEITARLN